MPACDFNITMQPRDTQWIVIDSDEFPGFNLLMKLSKSLKKISIGGKFLDSEESSYAENGELENLVPDFLVLQ